MDPRNIFPGECYLIRVETSGGGCGMTPLEEVGRLFAYILAWNDMRFRARDNTVKILAVCQTLDGYMMVVQNTHDGMSSQQRDINRTLSFNRNRALNRVGHAFFKKSRFDAYRLHTDRDVWYALLEVAAYPVTAGIVRHVDHYEGLHLTPSDLGAHSFLKPVDFESVAMGEEPDRAVLHIEMAPVGIKDEDDYRTEFKRLLRERIDAHEDDRKPMGCKRASRKTLRDPAPRPKHPEDSPLDRDQPAWCNHFDESVDEEVTRQLKRERKDFLDEYSEAYSDIQTYGWEGFRLAVFPPGTYGWRRKLKATVRGSPGTGLPAPREAIDA